MQDFWLIIVVFFLIILIAPIIIKINISYDLLNNIGSISIYLFLIKIIEYKIKYQNMQIVIFSQKDAKDIPIQISAKKLRFIEQLSSQLKNKVIIKNAKFFSRIGVNDAYATALLIGLVSSIIGTIIGVIKNKKKSAKFEIINIPEYNENFFAMSLTTRCHIAAFDILYALIISLLIVQRSEKYERV